MLTQWQSWMDEAFATTGMALIGRRLWAILEEAGLRPLGMTGIQPHFGPGDKDGIAYLVENMRVMEPLLVNTGVATAEQISMETFEQQLSDEWERTRAVAGTFIFLSAWATTGPE